jgi:multidrug transporter EmrE-like cation transporter
MRGTDFGLILTGVLLNAVAQLLLKAGARAFVGLTFSMDNLWPFAERALVNPPILVALVCYAASVVVWTLALVRVDVSVAYPMLSIGYVVNALMAWWLFGEQLTGTRVAGIAVIGMGVWLISRSQG